MALVMIVIRDVADRFHGFLSSAMLEVAPNGDRPEPPRLPLDASVVAPRERG